jgi:hypothetical protein
MHKNGSEQGRSNDKKQIVYWRCPYHLKRMAVVSAQKRLPGWAKRPVPTRIPLPITYTVFYSPTGQQASNVKARAIN